ncbi:protein-L-isoaspartate(D-aspartate) O-methyltransferase [Patescibacteria group bacterium]
MNLAKKALLGYWTDQFNFSEDILAAFIKVRREDFILNEHMDSAYADGPLPIGEGQTISQPTTVMIMLDLLEIHKDDRILEIGCGSGYNAALMAEIAKKGEIYTTDIVETLAEKAKSRLAKYKNIKVFAQDGFEVAQKHGPFDKIIITAAARNIPKILIDNLKEGGIILAPVGDMFMQEMIKLRKHDGKIKKEKHGSFMFVPVRGEYGF